MPLVGLLLATQLMLLPQIALSDHSSSPSASREVPQSISTNKACTITTNLSVGDRGDSVTCLQKRLLADGFLQISAPTGYFGSMTKSAVMKWQRMHRIAATGYFGPLSIAALDGNAHPYYQQLEDSHKTMMAAFMSTSSGAMHSEMADTRKVIAVVLYNEFEPLDAIGPLEVLGQMPGYKVVTVAKQKGEVASAFGTKMIADYSFDELKSPAIIVVPGGLFGTIAASKDPTTLAWLKEADKKTEYTTSVCTGAWILAAAGLLDGRAASTHWTGADYLQDFGVKYTGKRYTVDGKYVTAAGVSAGIDMSFKLIEMIAGRDAAKVAQLGLEYDPQPPFNAGSPGKADPALVKIMRGQMKDHMMAASMMYGTSTTPTTMSHHDTHVMAATTTTSEMHMHSGIDVSSWPAKPTVAITMHPDSMGGWNLEITTTNFQFAPQNVNGVVIPNQGHAHLYIDGVKIARVYGNWYNVPASILATHGTHQVKVTLNANDHSELMSNGTVIQATETISN